VYSINTFKYLKKEQKNKMSLFVKEASFLIFALDGITPESKLKDIAQKFSLILKIRGISVNVSIKDAEISLNVLVNMFNNLLDSAGLSHVFLSYDSTQFHVKKRASRSQSHSQNVDLKIDSKHDSPDSDSSSSGDVEDTNNTPRLEQTLKNAIKPRAKADDAEDEDEDEEDEENEQNADPKDDRKSNGSKESQTAKKRKLVST
jgi:trehalose/maltose hydrolase-like predicted phosphorylase